MGGRVTWRSIAVRDLGEAYAYIGEEAPEAAERLLDSVERSIELLLENPSAGRLSEFPSTRARGIRSWSPRGFPNYLIFYKADGNGLEIIRFLHGARDLPQFLEGRG
jgi:toxin ParE1/3/4